MIYKIRPINQSEEIALRNSLDALNIPYSIARCRTKRSFGAVHIKPRKRNGAHRFFPDEVMSIISVIRLYELTHELDMMEQDNAPLIYQSGFWYLMKKA